VPEDPGRRPPPRVAASAPHPSGPAGGRTTLIPALRERQALALSVLAALVTMTLKLGAWYQTGSVGLLSDALEALVNLAGASFALLMVIWAQRPPDRQHPFGHGKAEYFSSAFEGLLIVIAAVAIFVSAAQRLLHPQPLQAMGLGLGLTALATLVNFVVALLLLRSGRVHRSLATEADGRHLMTDVWTSIGVAVGVGIAWLSGRLWLDPVVAILVGLNILREGWELVRRSFDGLMDSALPDTDITAINAVLDRVCPDAARFTGLRTRSAGRNRFAYVELHVPGDWPVSSALQPMEQAERELARAGITLTIRLRQRSG